MAKVISNQGEKFKPKVIFSDEARTSLSEPYKEAIIIKVLGKRYSYTAMVHRLKSVWRLKGGYHVMHVAQDYFYVKFDLLEDREKVLLGGPWLIDGHYLAVKPWESSFRPAEKSFGSTLVWIKISCLNIWYYQEEAMRQIATAVGKPIKIDLATKLAEKGKFARACVQIDLGKPVVREIEIDGCDYDIEYESLQLICDTCNCYGHVTHDCKLVPTQINDNHNQTAKAESPPSEGRKAQENFKASKGFEFEATTKPTLQGLNGANQQEHNIHDEKGCTKVTGKGKGKKSQVSNQINKAFHVSAQQQQKGKLVGSGQASNSAKSTLNKSGVLQPRNESTSTSSVLEGNIEVVCVENGTSVTPHTRGKNKRFRPASLQNSPVIQSSEKPSKDAVPVISSRGR